MSTLNTQQEFFALDWMAGGKTPTATEQGLGGGASVDLCQLSTSAPFSPRILRAPFLPSFLRHKTHPCYRQTDLEDRDSREVSRKWNAEISKLIEDKVPEAENGPKERKKQAKKNQDHYPTRLLIMIVLWHACYPTSCKTGILRKRVRASTDLAGIDEKDFGPLLDQVRAPVDDTENTAHLYITLDHCLTEGKLEELAA